MTDLIWKDPPGQVGDPWDELMKHPGKWALYWGKARSIYGCCSYQNQNVSGGHFERTVRDDIAYVRYVED